MTVDLEVVEGLVSVWHYNSTEFFPISLCDKIGVFKAF